MIGSTEYWLFFAPVDVMLMVALDPGVHCCRERLPQYSYIVGRPCSIMTASLPCVVKSTIEYVLSSVILPSSRYVLGIVNLSGRDWKQQRLETRMVSFYVLASAPAMRHPPHTSKHLAARTHNIIMYTRIIITLPACYPHMLINTTCQLILTHVN
jgi:hypothetical protein